MFSHLSNSDLSNFEELEALGTLDTAIANATERRRSSAKSEDAPAELLSEDAAQVMGGIVSKSVVLPPTTCGIIACEPDLL
jgi:hypothetical protein